MSRTRNAKISLGPLIAVIGILFATASPGVAAANSSVSTHGPALATICDGDCDQQSLLEARRQAAGFDQPFELGLKIMEDGLDLTIESDGNISCSDC